MPDELLEVTAEEAIALVAEGTALIDVREQDEWDAGHAPTAQLLPMSVIRDRLDELPSDQRLLVVCQIGGRSLRVAKLLREAGYDAASVVGGMSTWAAVGGPVEYPAS